MNAGLSSLRRIWSALFGTVFAAVVLNAFVFVCASLYLGGTADKVENGRYYLRTHGHYTEVSPQIYRYSEVHAHSVTITLTLVFLSFLLLYRGPSHKSRLGPPKGDKSANGA